MLLRCLCMVNPHTFTLKEMSGSPHGNLTARSGLDKSLRDEHSNVSTEMEMTINHDSLHENLEEGSENRKDSDPLLSRNDSTPKLEDTTSSRQVIFWLCFWMAK